jgi:hypothetical protein
MPVGTRHCSAAAALLVGVALAGCGAQSSEDKVIESSRSVLEAFKDGDHPQVCEQLTGAGRGSLVEAAAQKEGGDSVVECEAASRFLLDGTPEAGRNSFDVSGDPTDVDVAGDGARAQWEDCCTFELEELDGDYRVNEAADLGLYFEAAGAGAGAGGGSPSTPDPNELETKIRANLKDADRQLPGVGFSERVTEIRVDGTRVTLVATTGRRASETTGICRSAGGGTDNVLENLPGVSELSIETSDGTSQDCDELVVPL